MNAHETSNNAIKTSLLLLRISIFIVFFMWILDKFINPSHATAIFSKFYFYDGLSTSLVYGIGAIQLLIIFSFVLGIKKQLFYGLVFCMHLGSTLAAYEKYFDPWTHPNLLFFAAWPMLAAIAVLYVLREQDTLLTIKRYN